MISLKWPEAQKHQTNNSSSKATYAFPRDKRFKAQNTVLCDSFYNIPSTLGRAPASGIGRGNKSLLASVSVAPSPQNYNIKSDFIQTKKGGKFALGRENMQGFGIFRKSTTPEPGHYNVSGSISKLGFTIYSKLPPSIPFSMKVPSPAHYSPINGLSQTGHYVLSGNSNVSSYRIKESRAYDPSKTKLVPGPGHYNQQKENLNITGSYFNSKHENSRCRTFSRCAKKGLVSDNKLPGPGTYAIVSEFGS